MVMQATKVVILLMIMSLVSIGVSAVNKGVTFLFTNGQTASFTLASKPEILVTTDGLTIFMSDSTDISYQFGEVQKFYFEDDVEAGVAMIKCALPAQHPVFNYADGIITVSDISASENLVVTNLCGNDLNIFKADAKGTARIDLNGAPAGVYIISSSNGLSFKLYKK